MPPCTPVSLLSAAWQRCLWIVASNQSAVAQVQLLDTDPLAWLSTINFQVIFFFFNKNFFQKMTVKLSFCYYFRCGWQFAAQIAGTAADDVFRRCWCIWGGWYGSFWRCRSDRLTAVLLAVTQFSRCRCVYSLHLRAGRFLVALGALPETKFNNY